MWATNHDTPIFFSFHADRYGGRLGERADACGAVVYAPPVNAGCRVLDGPATVRG